MNLSIQKIAIVGLGNVGTQLTYAFDVQNFPLTQVYSRNLEHAQKIANELNLECVKSLAEISADLCIVCVSDDVINSVVNQLPKTVKIAYTSGSVRLQDLDRKHEMGVFYPLQSFSKGRKINLFEVPFLIESTDTIFSQELFDLAYKISRNVQFMNSNKRRELHLAAVFMNNFVNHQIYLAEQIAEKFSLDKTLLYPLLKETVDKAIENGAFSAQTGPAKRNNQNVIHAQEEMLGGMQKEIYQLMTKSIIDTYDKL